MSATHDHPVSQLCDPWGILLRRDAVEMGVDDKALARLTHAGVLVRLRQGAYCLRSTYQAADEAGRHLLLCRAALLQYADHVCLSHASSCLAQGGPAYGSDLLRAHLTHLHGGGRNGARISRHVGGCRVGEVRRWHGWWVTTPARAVVEVACADGVGAGLVQANHFLRAGLLLPDELAQQADAALRWPGSLRLHPVLHLADGRLESVGETLTSLLVFRAGLPRPEPQWEVRDHDGTLLGRVDFAWPEHRLIVEFDGREKYLHHRREGESISDAVAREKRREDLIREVTGWRFVRLTWADLQTPARTAERIRRALAAPAAPAA
ncbi:type IV toxin-antitoxin system AbiEi family antitoxin domain-containing protein [Nocardioides litoris]|uniref:type IV toxin-antitoxin system AbiEi family antitoxin domain-containing protein n=1 Tax=Nocardioides litoris TaxID=1926648 RepID=UPI001124BF31|nr:type IV toxin-antitoxin system AbiEi family antitoxin domain-containing protein [Nocardioides litoris]